MRSLLLMLCLSMPLAAQEWRSGDTHVHFQTCTGGDLSLPQIAVQQEAAELDFEGLQLWARWGDVPEYLSFAPLIDGADVLPGVRCGAEVSGFPASQFGHLQILDCTSGAFPVEALYSGPIFGFYKLQGALLGYAHVRWQEDYLPVPFYGGVGGAYMAPIDAALRALDFLETMEVEKIGPTSFRGLYYKLRSCGLRPGLAAGSDDTCGSQDGVGNPRTWVQAQTYEGFCDEIRAGRTTLSDGPEYRLELVIENGQATATLHGQVGSGVLLLLHNGQPFASLPYSSAGEDVALSATPPGSSGWLAARASGAHTAALDWIVSDEPIALAQDCQYWIDYCDAFAANISAFAVPAAEPEILAKIADARAIYAATLTRAQPWPAWASEYGNSTPGDWGPISIGLTASHAIDCLAAPSSVSGWLMIGLTPASLPISGITLLVSPAAPYALIPVASNSGGYAKVQVGIPSGKPFVAQFIFPVPGGGLCASDGLSGVRP